MSDLKLDKNGNIALAKLSDERLKKDVKAAIEAKNSVLFFARAMGKSDFITEWHENILKELSNNNFSKMIIQMPRRRLPQIIPHKFEAKFREDKDYNLKRIYQDEVRPQMSTKIIYDEAIPGFDKTIGQHFKVTKEGKFITLKDEWTPATKGFGNIFKKSKPQTITLKQFKRYLKRKELCKRK